MSTAQSLILFVVFNPNDGANPTGDNNVPFTVSAAGSSAGAKPLAPWFPIVRCCSLAGSRKDSSLRERGSYWIQVQIPHQGMARKSRASRHGVREEDWGGRGTRCSAMQWQNRQGLPTR